MGNQLARCFTGCEKHKKDKAVMSTSKPTSLEIKKEKGQPSVPQTKCNIPTFVCEICLESNPLNDSFNVNGCAHFYCTRCIVQYIVSKLEDNVTSIPCPITNCAGILEPDYCRLILPHRVYVKWGNALCESAIVGSNKFYCPYKDCSAMMVNELRGNLIRASKCPHCKRQFCVQCKVPWHRGMKCAEFQRLNKDHREHQEDILLMNLATKQNWKKCPNCRYYVEKRSGCMYMQCRCGIAFCYKCGAKVPKNQAHACPNCNR